MCSHRLGSIRLGANSQVRIAHLNWKAIEASRVEASLVMEALQRLQTEINAVFDAQRRSSNEKRCVALSTDNSTPKWAEVTALLASVGRPTIKTKSYDTTKQGASSLQSSTLTIMNVMRSATMNKMTASERQNLLRDAMREWRYIARAAAVVTRLHVRARKRREQRVTALVFDAWRRLSVRRFLVREAASLVVKKTKRKALSLVWRKWSSEHHRIATLRRFCLRRQGRLRCEVFCAWVLATHQRLRYRKYKQKAARQLLRRYWRWLQAGIETQQIIGEEVDRFALRRVVELAHRCFVLWGEHVEQCKRWDFAVRWSNRRMLGDAYDGWKEVHKITRRTRHSLQLAVRCRRRRVLRDVLKVWSDHARHALQRKRALVAVFHSQQRRGAFICLIQHARYYLERENSLAIWKVRRAVWMWHHRSHQHRMLRLRAEFLQENHERLVLRHAAWFPWRHKFIRSTALRSFTTKRRARQLRKTWVDFVDAINQQEHQRFIVESIADTREVSRMRHVIAVWRIRVSFAKKRKELIAQSTSFYSHGLARKFMVLWKEGHRVLLKERLLYLMSTKHLASKVIHHWAKWAFWSRRELGSKIAAVREQRRQQQIQQCVEHWRRLVHTRHKILRIKFLSAWKLAAEVAHRDRHVMVLGQLIQLRWSWKRWELLVQRRRDTRTIAVKAWRLHEQRLLRYSFVTIWLHKTRGYRLGSRCLARFNERRVLAVALSRWKKNQQQLRALQRAASFRRKSLLAYYLRELFGLTIGRNRNAIAYDRRCTLRRAWICWNLYCVVRRRRHEADEYYRRRTRLKAVRSLHTAAENSIVRRNQRLDAVAWHEAVVMQKIIFEWCAAAKHARSCRFLGQGLAWRTVGRRAFRGWQDALVERQLMFKAEQFRSSLLITRAWNAMLLFIRRRQVALAMWTHTATRIRLAHVFTRWISCVDSRRGQYAVATAMYRMQQLRTCQKVFTAWAVLVMTRRLASQRDKRESLRWRQRCWAHWKLWRISSRWRRSGQLVLLQNAFCAGLKRHAIQQQAFREICLRTARNLLHRSLAHWRIELWLVRSQNKLALELKRNALSHWKTFVTACRQQRRWEHYVQQLHRVETRAKVAAFDKKRRRGGTFRDTRALQAQLKRNRVLMTHVLHAWYLVVQNRRRRCSKSLSSAKNPRRRGRTKPPRSGSKDQQLALQFWARSVLQRCFFTWREQAVDKRAELA
ncbi:hypothetical protein ON010_g379 [Phytophthora cinnamomi]|nr:hypothetical protein ON010_g379 [Phytophthora cinnamomi]